MKRATELRSLSKDHHRALVIAKRAKQFNIECETTLANIWMEIEIYYSTELESHFRIEETYIAPHLESPGEIELIKKLYKEHDEIRCYFSPESTRTATDLSDFGKLLEQHVRFEERELFNLAQNSLSPDALASLEEICNKQ